MDRPAQNEVFCSIGQIRLLEKDFVARVRSLAALDQQIDDCDVSFVSKNEPGKHIGGASELDKLMVRRSFEPTDCNDFHPSELRAVLVIRLSRRSKLLNVRTGMTTVDTSERKFVLQKTLFPTMLKQTVDISTIELSRGKAGRSNQLSTVVVLVRSCRVQGVVFLLPENGAKYHLDLGHLEDGKPNLLASVGLWVERANGSLPPRSIVV